VFGKRSVALVNERRPGERAVDARHREAVDEARSGKGTTHMVTRSHRWACAFAGLFVTIGCDHAPAAEQVGARGDALATSADTAVLGFEDSAAWSVTQGPGLALRSSPVSTEGAASLAFNPSGFVVLSSRPIAVQSAITGPVSFDLWVPSEQANRYWFGAAQLYLHCPSHQVFNAFVGQVELTPLETGRFHSLRFSIAGAALAALNEGCANLSFSIALNVPFDQVGAYQLDNLQLATSGDLASPGLDCVFSREPSRYFARFSYENASASVLRVPVGAENSFSPGEEDIGQPRVFSAGTSAEPFTVEFDGAPLSWHLGRGTATASFDAEACPPLWVPAWMGRGPLSTTITTNRTTLDSVPNLSGRTLRLMAHLTTGGSQVRVRLSQRFSSAPLDIEAAHVAIRSAGSAIVPETDRALTFTGNSSVTVPAGEDTWSDAVPLDLKAGQDLAISIYVPGAFVPTTQGGRGQVKTAYYKTGNFVAATSLSGAGTTRQIFAAYEVQVLTEGPAAALVALGDSITEGACSGIDKDTNWPDLLAARLPLLSDGTAVAVLNAGIGSGRFASSDGAGLRGLTRLDELLTLPTVRWVTLLMGVNDISYELVDAEFLKAAFTQAIEKTHAAGKQLFGIPILPFGASVKDVGNNVAVAQEVNAWIRARDKRLGASEPSYDAVLDFEPVLLDPNAGWALRSDLTCDNVHPNAAGYRAMADSIPLELFR
jgi:lysophospholipase L1-like esterase